MCLAFQTRVRSPAEQQQHIRRRTDKYIQRILGQRLGERQVTPDISSFFLLHSAGTLIVLKKKQNKVTGTGNFHHNNEI